MNYRIANNSEIGAILAEISHDVKKSALLSGDWSSHYAVAGMVIDNIRPDAEIHEAKRDVWIIREGSGIFILGGKILNKKDNGGGEWTGDSIEGGEEIEVGPGDIIDIPPGIPHQIDARGNRLQMIIVKIAG